MYKQSSIKIIFSHRKFIYSKILWACSEKVSNPSPHHHKIFSWSRGEMYKQSSIKIIVVVNLVGSSEKVSNPSPTTTRFSRGLMVKCINKGQ
jgi:hypothetical protein